MKEHPMKINTKHTTPPVLLHLEAEQLATKIEQALRDPVATRETFFLDVDHLADVLETLHRDEVPSMEVGVA